MSFGERLEEIMISKGLNMHKLAEQSGISYNTVYSIIKRKSNAVSYPILEKLASALDIDPFELLYGKEASVVLPRLYHLIGVLINERQRLLEEGKYTELQDLNKTIEHFTNPYSPFKNKEELSDRLNQAFAKLNQAGQQVAVDRVEELTEIKKYQKGGSE